MSRAVKTVNLYMSTAPHYKSLKYSNASTSSDDIKKTYILFIRSPIPLLPGTMRCFDSGCFSTVVQGLRSFLLVWQPLECVLTRLLEQ